MRDNRKRSRIVILLFWVHFGATVLTTLSSYMTYQLLVEAQSVDIDIERAEMNDLRDGAIALLFLATYIALIVVYINWFRRGRYNLEQCVPDLAHTHQQAGYAWFIPFVNLYQPYQIMKEMYERAVGFLRQKGIDGIEPGLSLVGLWWTYWVVANIANNVVTRMFWDAESLSELTKSTGADIILNLISLPLIVLAIKVVQNYSKIEEELYIAGDGMMMSDELGDNILDTDF